MTTTKTLRPGEVAVGLSVSLQKAAEADTKMVMIVTTPAGDMLQLNVSDGKLLTGEEFHRRADEVLTAQNAGLLQSLIHAISEQQHTGNLLSGSFWLKRFGCMLVLIALFALVLYVVTFASGWR